MSDESAVMEQEVTETKTRNYTPLTQAQKDAATFRREASLLRKYGNEAKAAELEAQADALAPVRATGNKRVDPLKVLSTEEVSKLMNHFKTTKAGFANIAAVVSTKKLANIAASV